MHALSAIATIWQRELLRYWRDKTRIVSTLAQPLMFLTIFGFGLRRTLATGALGVDFVLFMYPGILAISVMSVAFFSTISTVWDREFGFLKEILVAPIPRTAIALGKTLGAMTVASIQAVALLALAPLIHLRLDVHVLPSVLLVLLVVAFTIAGFGLLVASLMRTTESFGLVMQLLVFPMFFLSGAFFPLTAVPRWMAVIAHMDPLIYGVDALRQLLLQHQVAATTIQQFALYPVAVDVLILCGFSGVMISAAVAAFNRAS